MHCGIHLPLCNPTMHQIFVINLMDSIQTNIATYTISSLCNKSRQVEQITWFLEVLDIMNSPSIVSTSHQIYSCHINVMSSDDDHNIACVE